MRQVASTGKKQQAASPSYFKTILKISIILLIAILVLLNLFTHIFSVVRYYGNGMEPTLHDGQILVIRKTDQVEQGDIVACYYNNKVLVRRVVCEGGKTVSINSEGFVTVNDIPLEEPYVEDPSIGQCNITFPCNVSVGQYFVLGDNRAIAMDSRLSEIGNIPQDRILGEVIWII